MRASNPLLLRTGTLGSIAGGLLFAVWGYLHQDNAPLYFNTIAHILAGIVPVLFLVGLATWGLDRVVYLPCGGLEHAGVLSRTLPPPRTEPQHRTKPVDLPQSHEYQAARIQRRPYARQYTHRLYTTLVLRLTVIRTAL